MCLHMVVTCQGFPVPKFPGSSGTDGVTATFLQSSSEKSSNTRNRFIGELPTQIFFILWRIHLRRKKQRIIIININRESRYCESVELVLLRWSALALGKAIERLTQQFKQGINHTKHLNCFDQSATECERALQRKSMGHQHSKLSSSEGKGSRLARLKQRLHLRRRNGNASSSASGKKLLSADNFAGIALLTLLRVR